MGIKTIVVLLVGSALASVHLVEAQQSPKKVWVIGVLRTDSPSIFAARNEVFRQGLRDLGYVEGKTLLSSTDTQKENWTGFPIWRRNSSV